MGLYSEKCARAHNSPPVWPVGWGPCGLRGVWCPQCALPWTPGCLRCRQCRADHAGEYSHVYSWPVEGRKEGRGPGRAWWETEAVWRLEVWTYIGSGPGEWERGRTMSDQNKLVSLHQTRLTTFFKIHELLPVKLWNRPIDYFIHVKESDK